MKWRKTTILHGRKDHIDLFVAQRGKTVTAHVVIPSTTPRCHSSDRLLGQIADIRLDQHGTLVDWCDCELPACCRSPELDMRQKPNPPGLGRTLDYLRYHLANAMIAAFSYRAFSHYFKKLVVGEWTVEGGSITFEKDGHYRLSGVNRGNLAAAPESGRWYSGKNMLHLMTDPPNQGIRTLVVGINEKELMFPGAERILRYVYRKNAP